jgi:hypothetical protein
MITFAASTNGVPITLTIGPAGDANANNGDLDIGDSVTIMGNGPANTIIQAGTTKSTNGSDGNGIDRVFQINPFANKTLSTVFNGVTVRNGKTTGACGGIQFDGADFTSAGCSSGCFDGTLTLTNTVVTDNFSVIDGAGVQGIDGFLTINSGSIISNNKCTDCDGGGIKFGSNKTASTVMTINGSTISGNIAESIRERAGRISARALVS